MSRGLLFHHPLHAPDDALFETLDSTPSLDLDLHLHLSMATFSPDDEYIYADDDNYLYGGDEDHGDDLFDRLPHDDDGDDDWRSFDDLVLSGAAAPSDSPDVEDPSLDLVLGIGDASSETADLEDPSLDLVLGIGDASSETADLEDPSLDLVLGIGDASSETPDLEDPSLDVVLGIGDASSESPDLDLDLDLDVNLHAASLEEGDAADSSPTWIDAHLTGAELLWEGDPDDLPLSETAFDLARGDAEADPHAWEVFVEIDGELQDELPFGAEEDGLGIVEVEVGNEPSTSGRAPVATSVVEGLPSVVVAEGEGLGERVMCAICKEEVAVGGTVKRLPCLHGYHEECIVPWLMIRNTCPVCRHVLPTEEDVRRRGHRGGCRRGYGMGFEEDFVL